MNTKKIIKLTFRNKFGGYDRDLGTYVNCLTEISDTSRGKLWKIKGGKAYSASYGEGKAGMKLEDGSVPCVDGIFTVEVAQ